MGVLKCSIHENALHLDNYPLLTSGSKGIDLISVSFDEDWLSDDYIYKVSFYRDKGNQIIRTLYEDGFFYASLIPDSILATPGIIFFSVFAIDKDNGNIIRSSNSIAHVVTEGLFSEEEPAIWPTEANVFKESIVNALNEKFNLNLSDSSNTDDILEAIDSVELMPLDEDFAITFLRIWSEISHDIRDRYSGDGSNGHYPDAYTGYMNTYPDISQWILAYDVPTEPEEIAYWTESPNRIKSVIKNQLLIASKAMVYYTTIQLILSDIAFNDLQIYGIVHETDSIHIDDIFSSPPNPNISYKQVALAIKEVFDQLRLITPYQPWPDEGDDANQGSN